MHVSFVAFSLICLALIIIFRLIDFLFLTTLTIKIGSHQQEVLGWQAAFFFIGLTFHGWRTTKPSWRRK